MPGAENSTTANGIRIVYESFGPDDGPLVLLIMGFGAQLTGWPLGFCEALTERGYRVVRFDNRDVGLSEKFDRLGKPNLPWMAVRRKLGFRVRAPYTLDDMADDTFGLLDALGVDAAHVVGVSMGGMIGQVMALRRPERVLSLCSWMSTSGEPKHGNPSPKVMRHLGRDPGTELDARIEWGVDLMRILGSPEWPPDLDGVRARIREGYARTSYVDGSPRQLAAILAADPRTEALKALAVPLLVIHGREDPLIPVEAGVDTARAAPDARLEVIDGLGHDIPPALFSRFVDLIDDNAKRAKT